MSEGEMIKDVRDGILEKLNQKVASIENEYKKFIGKLMITDLSIKSLPTVTGVHTMTSSGVENDVALVFDLECHGGLTFQLLAQKSVLGPVKFIARLDYFKAKMVIHFKKDNNGENCWIISLSEAPKISLVLGLGRHNLGRIAKILQKILSDQIEKAIVFPNLFKYIVRKNIVGFGNSFFKIDDRLPSHYAIKIVRGRNLPIKADLRGPYVVIKYPDREYRSSTGKCITSPKFGSIIHFPFSDKSSTIKVMVCQKNKLTKAVAVIGEFEFHLALFSKVFKRLRFKLDGSLLKQFSKKATYLSLDVIYYEKKEPISGGISTTEALATFMFGVEADVKLKDVATIKRKSSNIISLLRGSRDKKPSFSSTDLNKFLEGDLSTVVSDVQFAQSNFRDMVSGLVKFWRQQMDLLKGTKGGDSQILALSDVSKCLSILLAQVNEFLDSFTVLQKHQSKDIFREMNELCDLHDEIGVTIRQAYRFLSLKSTKAFKFLPQILHYLIEISKVSGQIGSFIYEQPTIDTEFLIDDSTSVVIDMAENGGNDAADGKDANNNRFSLNLNASSGELYTPSMYAKKPSILHNSGTDSAEISTLNKKRLVRNRSAFLSRSPLLHSVENINDQDCTNLQTVEEEQEEQGEYSADGFLFDVPDIDLPSSDSRGSTASEAPASRNNSSLSIQYESPLLSDNDSFRGIPSMMGSMIISRTASEDAGNLYCRMFKSRCQFTLTDNEFQLEPNFKKLLELQQEGIFYMIENDTVSKILSDGIIASFKEDRKLLGTIANHKISFSKPDKANFSSLMEFSLMIVQQLSIKNVEQSHLNLLRIEFVTKKSPVFLAGEKNVVLGFFSCIASWMVYYDAINFNVTPLGSSSDIKNESSSPTPTSPSENTCRNAYSLKLDDIVQVINCKSSIHVYFKAQVPIASNSNPMAKPIYLSNCVILLRDFFGASQKNSAFINIKGHVKCPASENDTLIDEKAEFLFVRRTISPLPKDYFFDNFQTVINEEPVMVCECSVGGDPGTAALSSQYFFFKSSKISYIIPFGHVQSLKLISGMLIKGIKMFLNNGSIININGFKKGFRQPFFACLNGSFLKATLKHN